MSILKKFFLAVRFIGFWAVVQTILYALYRDWMNRGYKPRTEPILDPGTVQGFDATPRGGMFRFQNGSVLEVHFLEVHFLEVHFLAPDIIRMTWTPGKLPVSYALSDAALEDTLSLQDPTGYLAIRSHNDTWMFTTPALTLTIHKIGMLEYTSPSGQLLRREYAPVLNGESWSQ
jgi:alpha-glucosidase